MQSAAGAAGGECSLQLGLQKGSAWASPAQQTRGQGDQTACLVGLLLRHVVSDGDVGSMLVNGNWLGWGSAVVASQPPHHLHSHQKC